MPTGIELFQHRFSGNPENHYKNPDLANKEATRGTQFWDLFGDFFEIISHQSGRRKNRTSKMRLYYWVKFCAEGANFLEPRLESVTLDAVLEDKPVQPLPCGKREGNWSAKRRRKWIASHTKLRITIEFKMHFLAHNWIQKESSSKCQNP